MERLFEPLAIGPVTIKNRIFSSGHDTVMAEDGLVTDQLVEYHRARAEGGAGLIVMQVSGVHESARYTSHVLMATEDSSIPGYAKVAAAVHPSGCKIFGQLFHPGREVMESQDGSMPVTWSASSVPNERFKVMPRELDERTIAEIVVGYAAAALRLQAGGLDGVEVVASHGYLPAQFLNSSVNRRSDSYGGDLGNRLRFLREILEAVRAAVGPTMAVGIRISGDELDPSGLVEDDALAACAELDRLGLLDYVSVTVGTSASLSGSDHIVPPMSYAVGYTASYAARVKKVVKVPVLVAGRINQPQDAARIIEQGSADACAMTRALICDPEMPAKAMEGRAEEIRACIACNQACIGHFHAGYPISCIQHPETGRELLYGRIRRATVSRNVVVIGGGPAGLKAAAVAAERGHSVTLFEARSRLGGQVRLASALPEREEFGGAIDNLYGEASRAGARFELGHAATADEVRRMAPAAVVVATGAKPRRPELETMGTPSISDAWAVISAGGRLKPQGRTVVADWRSDWVGIGVARMLAANGHSVVIAVGGYAPGESLQQYVRDSLVRSLYRERIEIMPLVRIVGADEDSVYLQHVLTGEPVIVEQAYNLVLAQGSLPEDELLRELAGDENLSVTGIGDCLAPRTVEEAVLEGLRAAWTI
ncbi:MAG: FAD-dependent oxidoreductase [Actinomycetota bacterium]|nr:FAD-dependent oxidoreductase [Actinomycetota bacterium]